MSDLPIILGSVFLLGMGMFSAWILVADHASDIEKEIKELGCQELSYRIDNHYYKNFRDDAIAEFGHRCL